MCCWSPQRECVVRVLRLLVLSVSTIFSVCVCVCEEESADVCASRRNAQQWRKRCVKSWSGGSCTEAQQSSSAWACASSRVLVCATLFLPAAAVFFFFNFERPDFAALVVALSKDPKAAIHRRERTPTSTPSRRYTERPNASISVSHVCRAASSSDVHVRVCGCIYAASRGLLALISALVVRALPSPARAQRFTVLCFLPPPPTTLSVQSCPCATSPRFWYSSWYPSVSRETGARVRMSFQSNRGVRWMSNEMGGYLFIIMQALGVSRWLWLCVVYECKRTREKMRKSTLTAHKRVQRHMKLERLTRL